MSYLRRSMRAATLRIARVVKPTYSQTTLTAEAPRRCEKGSRTLARRRGPLVSVPPACAWRRRRRRIPRDARREPRGRLGRRPGTPNERPCTAEACGATRARRSGGGGFRFCLSPRVAAVSSGRSVSVATRRLTARPQGRHHELISSDPRPPCLRSGQPERASDPADPLVEVAEAPGADPLELPLRP